MKLKNQRQHRYTTKLATATSTALLLVAGLSTSAHADHKWKNWGPSVPQLRTDGMQVPGGCPIESPAGTFLFTARNPGTGLDIYVNQRAAVGEAFAPGHPLPAPINDPALAGDFCPTPQPDGGLYFISTRSDSCGDGDMYRAVNNPATGWSVPQNLGCEPAGPNTPGLELSPSILTTAWGTYLFFSTNYHSGNQDIYVSSMRSDGTFTPGKRLGWPINTEHDDRQPNVSQDGREIVFASNRPSAPGDTTGFDIFSAKRVFLFAPWRRVVNLSETAPFDTVNTDETRPSLSWDGERLYYGSGGVWISRQTR